MKWKNEVVKKYEDNGQDRFNYCARYGTSNVQIQTVITFCKDIDFQLLKHAVRLSINAEPILGCYFVENDKQAYWERFENIEEILWCSYEETENAPETIDIFLKRAIGCDGQQQVEVKLAKSSKENVLGIKMNHACTDVGGVKQYLSLLSEIYTHLCDNPKYVPIIEDGRRDSKNYFSALGIEEPMALFNPNTEISQPTWAFPYHSLEFFKMNIETVRFPAETFMKVKCFAKEKGVTINTIILTAFYRGLFELLSPEQGEKMEVYVTTDLRKYIPYGKKQAICNLSSMFTPRIERLEGESFEQTLNRVDEEINRLKNTESSLGSAIMMEALGRIDYSHCLQILKGAREQAVINKKSTPLLSNAGIIPTLKFGKINAEDAYIITPSMLAPGFMLGVSTYKDQLTLVVSFYEPATRKEDVKELLDRMKREIFEYIL